MELACAEPAADRDGERNDPIAELRALMADEVAGSRALMDDLRKVAEDLRLQIPADARDDLFGVEAEDFTRFLGAVMRDGVEETVARLRADAERAP